MVVDSTHNIREHVAGQVIWIAQVVDVTDPSRTMATGQEQPEAQLSCPPDWLF